MPVATGNTVAGHGKEECMKSRGLCAEEIPGRIVGGTGLGNLAVGLGLAGVDQIRELNGILDEEDGNVVSNEIPVTLFSIAISQSVLAGSLTQNKRCQSEHIQSGREAMDISDGIGAAPRSQHG